MVELTHQQARSLLQAASDHRINSQEKTLLDAHIAACADCNRYAHALEGLQADLRRLTRQHWDGYSPAFSVGMIKQRAAEARRPVANPFANFGLTIKFAAITIVVMLLAFTLNLTGPQPFLPAFGAASAPAPNAAATPTPAITKTATQVEQIPCQYGSHIVVSGETLADIAARYAIAPEKILESNHLPANAIHAGLNLVIPVCLSTPTGTMTVTPMSNLGSPTPVD